MRLGAAARKPSLREMLMWVAGMVLCVVIVVEFEACSGRIDRQRLAA